MEGSQEPNAPDSSEHSASGHFSTEQINQLILDHRDISRKIAINLIRKWNVRLSEEDLQSLTDLATCEAARRYSPEHGTVFSTFLFYYVRGHLIEFVRESLRRKELSRHWNGKAESDSPDCVYPTQSSQPVAEELLPQVLIGPEQALLQQGDRSAVLSCLTKLENLEHAIISALYLKNMSQREISRTYGLKRGQIARIKERGLSRLKSLLAKTDAAPEGSRSTGAENNSVELNISTLSFLSRRQRRSRRSKAPNNR